MFTGMLHTHKLVVTLFLLLYLIKTILLLLNKTEALKKFSGKTRIAEMIISTLFLLTGIYLAMNSGNIGKLFWIKIALVAVSIPVAVIAYKKLNKGLALVSLLLIVGAYGLGEMNKKGKKISEGEFANVDAAQLGKTIYDSKCMNCHGSDGKLGLSGAKDLTVSTLSVEEKKQIIANGKNAMMSYKDQLSAEQISAVTEYISTFK